MKLYHWNELVHLEKRRFATRTAHNRCAHKQPFLTELSGHSAIDTNRIRGENKENVIALPKDIMLPLNIREACFEAALYSFDRLGTELIPLISI